MNYRLLSLLVLISPMLSAEEYLVRQGDIAVGVTDIDAIMNNVPAEMRAGVIDDPSRIQQYLQTLMVHRLMATQAQAASIGEDVLVEREIQQAIEKILSKHLVNKHLDAMKMPGLDVMAREQYAVNKKQYLVPESVDVSHILIDTKDRTDEEAFILIKELRARIEAGESINTLAEEFSDDPSVVKNKGRLNNVTRGNMVPSFEEAAFSLNETDSVSDIVETRYGYHVIKFHQRRPEQQQTFDDVKVGLIAKIRKEMLARAREDFIDSFSTGGPEMEFNESEIQALRQRYADGTIPSQDG